jgi:hypothetical protein
MHERGRIIRSPLPHNRKMTSKKSFIQESVNTTLLQALILLNRQYELIAYLHEEREVAVLSQFEYAISKGVQTVSCVYPVYEYVFSLIDNLVRYHKILNSVPRVSQKDAIISSYNRLLKPLKDARNKLQHINNHLDNAFSGPLMGSICWSRESHQFIASLFDIQKTNSVCGIALDTYTGRFVTQFVYIENDIHYDLCQILEATQKVHEVVASQFDIQIDGQIYNPKMFFLAGKLTVNFRQGG